MVELEKLQHIQPIVFFSALLVTDTVAVSQLCCKESKKLNYFIPFNNKHQGLLLVPQRLCKFTE